MTITAQPLVQPWISVGVRGIDNRYTPPWDCFKITQDRETRHDGSRVVSRMSER